MASTTYPCPACFQAQRVEHQGGQEIPSSLCAACAEEAQALKLTEADYTAAAHKLRAARAQALQG